MIIAVSPYKCITTSYTYVYRQGWTIMRYKTKRNNTQVDIDIKHLLLFTYFNMEDTYMIRLI